MNEVEAFIRQTAQRLGVDPEIAVRVAMAEGGVRNPVRQSDVINKAGLREPSYGPFQLLIGGGSSGFPEGLGNRALVAGIDPRDPNQWKQGVQFALQEAKQKGWGQWYGAAKAGVGRRDGLGDPASNQYALMSDGPKGQEVWPTPAPQLPPPYDVADRPVAEAQEQMPQPPKAKGDKEKKPTIAEALGEGISAMGDSFKPQPFQRSAQPAAARMDAEAPMAPFDNQQAEQQRQMLALAMQRLNSGRLFT